MKTKQFMLATAFIAGGLLIASTSQAQPGEGKGRPGQGKGQRPGEGKGQRAPVRANAPAVASTVSIRMRN